MSAPSQYWATPARLRVVVVLEVGVYIKLPVSAGLPESKVVATSPVYLNTYQQGRTQRERKNVSPPEAPLWSLHNSLFLEQTRLT